MSYLELPAEVRMIYAVLCIITFTISVADFIRAWSSFKNKSAAIVPLVTAIANYTLFQAYGYSVDIRLDQFEPDTVYYLIEDMIYMPAAAYSLLLFGTLVVASVSYGVTTRKINSSITLRSIRDGFNSIDTGVLMYRKGGFLLLANTVMQEISIDLTGKRATNGEVFRTLLSSRGNKIVLSDGTVYLIKENELLINDKKINELTAVDVTLQTRLRKEIRELEEQKESFNRRLSDYSDKVGEVTTKKEILDQAKKEAMEIVQGANKTVENTIRTIKESQAEKEKTRDARSSLQDFVSALQSKKEKELKDHDDYIEKKLRQLEHRKQKKNSRRTQSGDNGSQDGGKEKEPFRGGALKVGEKVRVKDNGMVGEIVRVSNKAVTIAVGNITSQMPPDRVERISSNEYNAARKATAKPRDVRDDSAVRERRLNFSPELDVRGERVGDALGIVTHYIDDAIMLGIGTVRIIHGKGTGALRDELQKYLRTIPGVSSVRDEHIQFGGSGVTIVDFD